MCVMFFFLSSALFTTLFTVCFQEETSALCNAVVTPLRKAVSYEERKTDLGSSP